MKAREHNSVHSEMAQCYLLALFDNFDDVEAAITELLNTDIKGFNAVDDLSIQSPIEHPDVEDLLGEKPVYVQWVVSVQPRHIDSLSES